MSGHWFKQYLFTEKHICKYKTNGTGSDRMRNPYIYKPSPVMYKQSPEETGVVILYEIHGMNLWQV